METYEVLGVRVVNPMLTKITLKCPRISCKHVQIVDRHAKDNFVHECERCEHRSNVQFNDTNNNHENN